MKWVDEKNCCCGCAACVSVCPKNAISMQTDEWGFVYPVVNDSLCVNCGLCKKNCAFQSDNIMKNAPSMVYAVYNKDSYKQYMASSGGVFEQVASCFIENGGYVCGAVLDFCNGVPYVHHILTNNIDDLKRIRGSKYTHSDTEEVYAEIRSLILQDTMILFSGTPCQIEQVKRITKGNEDKIYTLEILCHGVPGQQMFRDVIKHWNSRLKGSIVSFRFRDKALGWGHNVEILYNKNNKLKKKTVAGGSVAYFGYFLRSMIVRPNCFHCPYAGIERVGDLTIGDYWGVQNYHPELSEQIKQGISCVLVNSSKGSELINDNREYFVMSETLLDNVRKLNGSLNTPNKRPSEYDTIMSI